MLFDDTVQLHRSFSCEQGAYVTRIGSVEWDDFELSVCKDLEESVRGLFQLSILAVASM
jgi:hypothetical protein